MKPVRTALLALVALAATGCFRQVVNTGRTPSGTVIVKPWVNTFLWGLVPAKPIDVTADCPAGIATVVTEQSFMNGVAYVFTLGIWGPRHVTVTCSTRTAMRQGLLEVAAFAATAEARRAALHRAIEESARLGEPVIVRF